MLAELGSVEGKSHFSPKSPRVDKKSRFCRPESDLRPKSQGWVRLLKVGGLLSAYKEAVLPLHEHRQRESLEQLANPITRKSEREMRRKIK